MTAVRPGRRVAVAVAAVAVAAMPLVACTAGAPREARRAADALTWAPPTAVAVGAPRPTRATTGVPEGMALRRTGPITADAPGQVIEGVDVDGSIEVKADNVTIRNARVRGAGPVAIRIAGNVTGTVVERVDIGPDQPDSAMDGVWALGTGFVGRNLYVHSVTDGFKASGTFLLEASLVTNLTKGSGDHSDAVQIQGGAHFLILASSLEGSNASVMADSSNAPLDDVQIRGSWLDGGAWTLNIRGGKQGVPTRTAIVGNTFGGAPLFGRLAIDGAYDASGNLAADGTPIEL